MSSHAPMGQTSTDGAALERHDLITVPIAHIDGEGLLEWAVAAAQGSRPQTCFGVNTNSLTVASSDPAYLAALQACDVVLCDGIGVQLAALVLPGPVPQRIIITDYHDAIHAQLAKENGAVFIVGYEPGVAEVAAAQVHARHPGLREVGHHDGFFEFGSEREHELIAAIKACRPNVLWVGMGNPRQELFVHQHLEQLGVPLVVTCGAMWKYDIGMLTRPPRWISNLGIEWLYRSLTQGRDMWKRYGYGIGPFAWVVLREWMASRTRPQPDRD